MSCHAARNEPKVPAVKARALISHDRLTGQRRTDGRLQLYNRTGQIIGTPNHGKVVISVEVCALLHILENVSPAGVDNGLPQPLGVTGIASHTQKI